MAQTSRADGGIIVGGVLDGRQFAVAIPRHWNHQSLLFAHGYATPDSSVAVAIDPVANDPSGGLLKIAYDQGFAVGHSAYDKSGMAVESGAKATLRLLDLVKRLGATRNYVAGASMGGSIVTAILEQHSDAFAGGLSACGVTGGWEQELEALTDMRAVYNYYTRGTAYALPGVPDLSRSALPTVPPAGSAISGEAFRAQQLMRMVSPVLKLFADADRDPLSPAAIIVREVSSLTAFDADPVSFGFPLFTIGLGMDDMDATFGGVVYGNRGKIYSSPMLTAEQKARLNRDIQRIDADPRATQYAREWHATSGTFEVPLVAIHNRIDPLVPYSQALTLEERVASRGDTQRLTLITVPPLRAQVPGVGVTGYIHCGFTPAQLGYAWSALREQVER